MKLLFMALLLVVCSSGFAQQKPPQLSDLEKLEQYQRAVDATNRLEALVEEQSARRSLACMRAFGHAAMCKCLSDKLPFAFSFGDYVAITTLTKAQNGFDKLDKSMQKAYDSVAGVRDKCVSETIR